MARVRQAEASRAPVRPITARREMDGVRMRHSLPWNTRRPHRPAGPQKLAWPPAVPCRIAGDSVFEALFRFFFEYSPAMFAQGDIRWAAWTGSFVAVAVTAVAIAAALVSYRGGAKLTAARSRWCSPRCAWRCCCSSWPACSVPCSWSGPRCRSRTSSACCWTTPARCRLPTPTAQPRASYVQSAFGALDAGTLKALADRFTVRVFRFSSTATRVALGRRDEVRRDRDPAGRRAGSGAPGTGRAAAGRARDGQRRRRHGRRRAGRRAARPQGRGVPVFTVGVGRETLDKDIQIGRVDDAAHRAQGHDAAGGRGGRPEAGSTARR